MAVNAGIVPFRSSLIKHGQFGEKQQSQPGLGPFLQRIVAAAIHISQITSFVCFYSFLMQLKTGKHHSINNLSGRKRFFFKRECCNIDVFPPCGCDDCLYDWCVDQSTVCVYWLGLLWLCPHGVRWRKNSKGPEVVTVCVGRNDRRRQRVFYVVFLRRTGETRHLRRASFEDLASCWPLPQIKLPQFFPSPPSTSLLLPIARHFCFHMADFSGNILIFVAFGVGNKVCCACQVFWLWLTPAPKLNCSVISCHPPSTFLRHICQ